MKFLKIEAFEKHLEETLPSRPSPLYGVVLSSPFERRFLIECLLSQIEGDVEWMCVGKTPPKVFLRELDSLNMFSEKRIFVYDDVDKLKKGELITAMLGNFPKGLHVIFAGASLHFYEELKRDMVLINLSKEKPWERTFRLKRWLLDSIRREGKSLTPKAEAHLAELAQTHFEALMQEIKKLVIYVGDRSEIDLETVLEVVTLQPVQQGWKLAEAIVWGGTFQLSTFHHLNPQELHSFLIGLRYQIQLGLIVASCLRQGGDQVIQREYPKLPYAALKKYKQLAKDLTISYFRESLRDLFNLEIEVRIKSIELSLLIDHFITGLEIRRLQALK